MKYRFTLVLALFCALIAFAAGSGGPQRAVAAPVSAESEHGQHSAAAVTADDGLHRVTTYIDYGVTYTGTITTTGRTAGCAKIHLGQIVHLVNAGLTLTCEDTGAAWWFEADTSRVDVYNIWLGEDYDFVYFTDY